MPKKPYNAADEKQVKDREEKDDLERVQELEDIKNIMKIPSGLRFFRRLMADGMVFTTTFTGNSQSYFLEGHRNLALKYLNDIAEATPNMVSKLMIVKKEEEGSNNDNT